MEMRQRRPKFIVLLSPKKKIPIMEQNIKLESKRKFQKKNELILHVERSQEEVSS